MRGALDLMPTVSQLHRRMYKPTSDAWAPPYLATWAFAECGDFTVIPFCSQLRLRYMYINDTEVSMEVCNSPMWQPLLLALHMCCRVHGYTRRSGG